MSITNNISRIVMTTVVVAVFSSCHIYNKFDVEKVSDHSALATEYADAKEANSTDSTAYKPIAWQDVFTDPILVDLINQALANNSNLENAKLNVDIAHAQLKGARLSYLPSFTLMPNGAGASYDNSPINWTYQLPLAVSWEIDIFGKLLNSNRAAKASLLQSEAYAQAVHSQIISGVANCYYAIVNLENQLSLSRQTAKLWGESVEVMKNLKLAGRVNEAAVVQSTAQYYSILASITDLELALHETNNSMSLLLNVMPCTWAVNTDRAFEAPNFVRAGIPMLELAARPDVRAAEQSLAAAYYTTNKARTAFYPNLTISANGGLTNLLGSVITNPGKWFVQLAGQLTMPLFSRGANIAQLEATKAQQKQALNNFEYTLLSASAEISDAMLLYTKSNEKADLLTIQVENLKKSVEYTQELLTLGTSTYLEVLTAQQSLLGAQMSQLSCELARIQAVINLYQALGGGQI